MQPDSQQQAYDRGITIFSPDGRLYQVEYAREAVKRGSASVGVRTDEGLVLAADRQTRSPLIEPDSIEKIHSVDDHLAIASAGHVADARQLVDFARRQAQVERLRYDQPTDVESLTKEVTDHIQQYTQTGGARPFGVALLVAGFEGDRPRLFETDPSGTPYEWQAVAIGNGSEAAREHLESAYHDGLDLENGVALAIAALQETNEELTPGGVEIATLETETKGIRRLTPAELEPHFETNADGGDTQ